MTGLSQLPSPRSFAPGSLTPWARLGIFVAAVTLAADQISKNLLLYRFGFKDMLPGDGIIVTPYFNIVMAWNEGVSFGLLQANALWGKVLLTGFALAVVVGLSIWLLRARSRLLALGLGLVIGGAIGNAIDRAIYGAVADFFDFHVMGFHWYIFNVADIGIVCGVGCLLLDSVWGPRPEDAPRSPAADKA